MIFNHPDLICAFSRRPPNMSLAYGEPGVALANRKNFLEKLGIDDKDLVCAGQIHGNTVNYIRESPRAKSRLASNVLAATDALITDTRNLALAVFTADCLSIFLYDPHQRAIALIHAGWRGTKDNITVKTIELMQKMFNTHPRDLIIGFGPAIRKCCYEVGGEFGGYFSHGLTKKDSRYYLDLVGVNKKQLLDSGVKERNIFDSATCTSCQNESFFSYRKEGNSCGRIMSVMMLK